jgi:hypothetical protein
MKETELTNILQVILVVVILLNGIHVYWSHTKLRALLGKEREKAPDNNFLTEQLIHLRSSINLIYAMLTAASIMIVLVGWNQLNKISSDVTKEIQEKSQFSLEESKKRLQQAEGLLSKTDTLIYDIEEMHGESKRIKELIGSLGKSAQSELKKLEDIQLQYSAQLDVLVKGPVAYSSLTYHQINRNNDLRFQTISNDIAALKNRIVEIETRGKPR